MTTIKQTSTTSSTGAPGRSIASIPVADEDAEVRSAIESAVEDLAEKPAPRVGPATEGDIPDWVVVPGDMKVPPGRQLIFVQIRAELTATPQKGDRQCIIWTLSDGDEKMAADRCQGNASRASNEYTKQMLRVVDGFVADWRKPKGNGSIDEFWREVGPKGRNLLFRVYSQLHMANDEELSDFFENCVVVRSTA